MNDQQSLLRYYQMRHAGGQWPPLVMALLVELDEAHDAATVEQLLVRSGRRMAAAWPIASAPTLGGLERAINAVLAAQHWGYCRIEELTGMIRISHYAAPLADGGEVAATVAYLRGAYEAWLGQEGMPAGLRVCYLDDGAGQCLRFAIVTDAGRDTSHA